jgi:hypothetical protein
MFRRIARAIVHGMLRCPACGYWDFDGLYCWACGYRRPQGGRP